MGFGTAKVDEMVRGKLGLSIEESQYLGPHFVPKT